MGVRGKPIDDATKLTVRRLRRQGYSTRRIAKLCGIARQSVIRITRAA